MRWLLEASRGGPTRAKIVLLLREMPLNINQIESKLDMNYRSILHNIEVLIENGLVKKLKEGHGAPYMLTDVVEKNWEIVEESIRRVLGE